MKTYERYETSLSAKLMICADRSQTLASAREDIAAVMRDSNRLSQILPVVDHSLERTVLSAQ